MFAHRLPQWTRFWLLLLGLGLLISGCTLTSETSEPESADSTTTITGAPVVDIYAPQPYSTYVEGVAVIIQARINNAGADLTRLQFTVDNQPIVTLQSPNTANAPAFSVTQTWPAVGIGAHTILVLAFRNDGTSGQSIPITIHVAQPSGVSANDLGIITPASNIPVVTGAPIAPNSPTNTPPLAIVPSNTPGVPTALVTAAQLNVRQGPGTNFPAISTLTLNQTAEILGLNLDGAWLKIRLNQREGWVSAQYVTVQGNIANLPREAGPPTPLPTALPTPTLTPLPLANLTIEGHYVNPSTPHCHEDFTVGMTIRNASDVTTATGLAVIRDIRAADGLVNDSSGDTLVSVTLPPRGSQTVTVTLNVSTYVNEAHRIEWLVDVNNQIVESNENDNRQAVEYTLPPCQ